MPIEPWRVELVESSMPIWTVLCCGYWSSDRQPSAASIESFIRSDDFFELPYPYLATRLIADILSDKRRKFARGDYIDIQSVARVLPYCGMVVVDSNMAERVRRLGLDKRFKVAVFSAGTEDLHQAAAWLDGLVATTGPDGS
jgi:hypothetical protein